MQRSSGQKNSHLAIGLYTLLALLLTWPLITRITTHVPGDGIDDPALAWNLWWIKTRLIEQLNLDIFHCDWMFFPIQINLAFYTLTPLNGLLSIPLQTASTVVLANNLLLLSSFVLSGLGAYLLARQELIRLRLTATQPPSSMRSVTVAALLAGLIYAFASSKLFYASLGQFNIASSQWIPFCILYLLRTGRASNRRSQLRYAAMAALFFLFQAWAELTYASFLAIFVVVWALWQVGASWRQKSEVRSQWSGVTGGTEGDRRRTLGRLLAALLLFAVIALIGLTPFLAAMIPDMRSEGDFFTSGGGFEDLYSADLAGYLLPTRLHPLLGHWIRTLPFQNGKGQQIYIGYSVLLLVAYGLWRILRNRSSAPREHSPLATRHSPLAISLFWSLNAFVFFLLTLGPHVRWMGHDLPIPAPFALISKLPFFSGNRYPSRYAVMLMLCMAVLAAFGMYELLTQRRKAESAGEESSKPSNLQSVWWNHPISNHLATALVALLFLSEHLSIPLPLSDFRVPAIYQRIADTPGDFTILELPTGWRNGAREIGKHDILFMMQQWYQTTHGKRRLGGNTSRNPLYKFQYFSEAPLISDLIALMNADQWFMSGEVEQQLPQMIAQAQANTAQELSLLGVRFVTLHVEKATPQLLRFVDEALPLKLIDEWHGDDWSGTPSTIRLYEVQAAEPFREVDLRSDLGKLYQGEGWSALRNSGNIVRPQADLLLNLPEAGGTLEVEFSHLTQPPTLTLNGTKLSQSATSSSAESLVVQAAIPPGVANQLVDRLEINLAGQAASNTPDNTGAPWNIGSSAGPFTVPITVRSAGLDVGDFAQIYVDGRQVAVNQRGYNLVALAQDGKLLASVAFDTLGNCGSEPPDEAASEAMAAWLAQWPAQTILIGAAKDEASCRLGESAVAALHKIGVATDLRGHFRWSHAFIGAVNAQPGEAIESARLLQPAEVRAEGRSNQQTDAADGPVFGSVGNLRYLAANSSVP